MINAADLVAANTAQLAEERARDAEELSGNGSAPPAGSVYPAKQLVLENGQYRAVDHEN